METLALFRSLITEPLLAVIGKPLLGVSYFILEYEVPDFALDSPNLTGPVAVHLEFSDTTLAIAASSRRPLRPTNAYHIEVTHPSADHSYLNPNWPVAFTEISASKAKLWEKPIGCPLRSVEVDGIHASPQAIRLNFPMASVIITTGSANDNPMAGDAEEILLVSDDEWDRLDKLWPEIWGKQWESGSPENYDRLLHTATQGQEK